LIVLLAILAFAGRAMANGNDLPLEIVLQGFVKIEDGRVHLLARVPLVLLSNLALPKRGPGYLDLANVDAVLKQAAVATGHQVELLADGAPLVPTTRELQLSLLSDRSFAGYATALTHLQGPPLPTNTDLFWTQGFFDVHFEYPLREREPNISIRLNLGPELGQRAKLRLEYLPLGEGARSYEISGDSGWIPLDPRWYQAAWLFAKRGFVDAFAFDRFVFLVCLVAPFRRFRNLLALVMVLALLQAVTLTAAAAGALAEFELAWLPLLSGTVLAAATVLLAIENLAAPALRWRGFIAATIGALGGFGLGRLLTDAWQFVGTHPVVAVASFNVGVALGAFVSLAIAVLAVRLLFASVLGPLVGLIVLSAFLGHASWHWMMDGGRDLVSLMARVPAASLWPALGAVAIWLLPALTVGLVAYFLPKRFDGATAQTLLGALQARGSDERSTGT
jgi:hypothetical protein